MTTKSSKESTTSSEAKKSISEKTAALNEAVDWFYSDDFTLDTAAEKYEATMRLAKDLQNDLKTLKNKIEKVNHNFSED